MRYQETETYWNVPHSIWWTTQCIIDFYIDDLPSPLLYRQNFVCGKKTCELMNIKPETVAGALKICYKTDFPNNFIILKIIATLGVTSCECERSNSELTLLKTYLRTIMGQSRLNGLALIHVHYRLELNMKKIIDSFARKHPRRMMLNDIINDSLN